MERYQNKIIEQTIAKAILTFSKTLDYIYPAYDDNGFHEGNLTFHFANAFTKRKHSNAIMEIPFYSEENEKHDRHIDAYLFDDKIGIFLESKRMINLIKAKEVSSDLLIKMNKKNLSYIRKECHLEQYPEKVFIMVLCESWKEPIKSWWTNGKYVDEKWAGIRFPYKFFYGKKDVKYWKEDESSLTWLYGYKQIEL